MELFIETLKIFGTIVGILTCFVIYYGFFLAIGEICGVEWVGSFLYFLVTLLGISYIAARDKMGAKL
tara:strand:+ start:1127 stop:1327 length:201 start_codon:yes stop_codon:yes gene_type:complete